jgi:hypothetical protein
MNFKLCSLAFFFLLLAGGSAQGQQTDSASQNKPSSSDSQGIFSRGDSDGNAAGNRMSGAASQQPPSPSTKPATPSGAALITDRERTALTYNSYAFEVHLEPTQHSLAVHAHLTAQNSSEKPLNRIALQLSSAFQWYSIQVDGTPVKFKTETIDSDIDHTGQLAEAVVTLAVPLAAGATIRMDVIYSGAIGQSAERLLRLGAPAKIANASEWDGIGVDFTALRGFGDVIWFPVSTTPVLLGQGAEMFDSVGKWKLRESNASISMHVLVEYLDVKPTVAFLNGYVVQPDGASTEHTSTTRGTPDSANGPRRSEGSSSGQSVSGQSGTAQGPASSAQGNAVLQIASFTLPPTRLGFSPLSFFVMHASHEPGHGAEVYSRVDNEASAATYESVIQQTRLMVEQWLGPQSKRPVVLVDLPNGDDLPFEERNILFLPLKADAASDTVGPVMAHMLGHAYFLSPRVWLNEGVAQFMTLLWIEQRAGAATAFEQIDSRRAALAITETTDPGVNPGQSLIDPWSDIYYRDKAADVLWMLRNIVGDEALGKALQAYVSADDHEPSYLQTLLQKSSKKDLEWFFDDWVYRDKGLPDLHIVSAYWRPILSKNSTGKNYLVSVDVQNDSFCATEVPVTVASTVSTQTQELQIPAHTRAVLRMLVDSKPTQVVVNDGSVPEIANSHHGQAVAPAQ